jgi:hypothetical protein
MLGEVFEPQSRGVRQWDTKHALPDWQLADSFHGCCVDTLMHERGEYAVGSADTQGAVTGAGQLDGGVHDAIEAAPNSRSELIPRMTSSNFSV